MYERNNNNKHNNKHKRQQRDGTVQTRTKYMGGDEELRSGQTVPWIVKEVLDILLNYWVLRPVLEEKGVDR